jgi:hypothetical protein
VQLIARIKIGLNRYNVVDHHTKQVPNSVSNGKSLDTHQTCARPPQTPAKSVVMQVTPKTIAKMKSKVSANSKGDHHSTFKGCPTYILQCARQEITKLGAQRRSRQARRHYCLTTICSELFINKGNLDIDPLDIHFEVHEPNIRVRP